MSKVFKVWPEPKDNRPYGPTPKQRLLFIESLPEVDTWVNASTGQPCEPDDPSALNLKRPHYHPVDVVLYIGGARCLGKDTPVLMYDGTIKMVQDIKVGDLLMGPDSKQRKVTELFNGFDDLIKITPIKGDPFVCSLSHTLSLKSSGARGKANGSITFIPLENYIASSASFKKEHKLWRTGVEFKTKNLDIDPYYIGLWLDSLF